MFVDAIFDVVPHTFYQCLIIVIFDMGVKTYVPTAWILMTGKTDKCYWQSFNWLTSTVQNITPAYVGVDFEWDFFSQVSNHFSDAELIGCKFHFKQAVRRKMISMGIPEAEVKFTMRSGVVDLITVIPSDELNKGIAYICTLITNFFVELYEDEDDDKLEVAS